jgi:antitoxin VapB
MMSLRWRRQLRSAIGRSLWWKSAASPTSARRQKHTFPLCVSIDRGSKNTNLFFVSAAYGVAWRISGYARLGLNHSHSIVPGRLRRHVVHHPVDVLDLVDDPRRRLAQKLHVERIKVRAAGRGDCAQAQDVFVGAAVTFHADGPDRQQRQGACQRLGRLSESVTRHHKQASMIGIGRASSADPCKNPDLQRCMSQLDIHQDSAMTSSTVFTSNRSQAVRLPKAVAFPEDVHQVDILKIGRSRVIVPQGKRWDDLFANGPRTSEDFMVEREQPPAEERKPL